MSTPKCAGDPLWRRIWPSAKKGPSSFWRPPFCVRYDSPTQWVTEKSRGLNHPSLASSLVNLGRVLQSLESWAEAEALHVRARDIAVAGFGGDHVEVANALVGIGLARLAQGKPARDVLAKSVEIYEAQEQASGSLPAARFGLARSLVGSDRARSLALAQQAKEGADVEVSAKIDAWLATQRKR